MVHTRRLGQASTSLHLKFFQPGGRCTVLLLHLGHGFAEGIDEAVHRHGFRTLGSSVCVARYSWRVSMKKHVFLLLNNRATFFVLQPDIWGVFYYLSLYTHTNVQKPTLTSCAHLLSGNKEEKRSRVLESNRPGFESWLCHLHLLISQHKMLIHFSSSGMLPGLKRIILVQESCSRNVSFVASHSTIRGVRVCVYTQMHTLSLCSSRIPCELGKCTWTMTRRE